MDGSLSAGWVCTGEIIAGKKKDAEEVLDIIEERADKKERLLGMHWEADCW